jgi:hypothetical protein
MLEVSGWTDEKSRLGTNCVTVLKLTELREILVLASKQVNVATAKAAADAMRRRLEGRPHSDSGEILAEERLR